MTSTIFVDYTPPAVDAAWLNDVNNFAYPETGTARRTVTSFAALRAVLKGSASWVDVLGIGPYWQDTSDTSTSDNGVTVIVANDGARWKLTSPPGAAGNSSFFVDYPTSPSVPIPNLTYTFPNCSAIVNGIFVRLEGLTVTCAPTSVIDVWLNSDGSTTVETAPLANYTILPHYSTKFHVWKIQTDATTIVSAQILGNRFPRENQTTDVSGNTDHFIELFNIGDVKYPTPTLWAPNMFVNYGQLLLTTWGNVYQVHYPGYTGNVEPTLFVIPPSTVNPPIQDGTAQIYYFAQHDYMGGFRYGINNGVNNYFGNIGVANTCGIVSPLGLNVSAFVKAYIQNQIFHVCVNWASSSAYTRGQFVIEDGWLWRQYTMNYGTVNNTTQPPVVSVPGAGYTSIPTITPDTGAAAFSCTLKGVSITVAAGGTGYTNNDVVAISGGTGTAINIQVSVSAGVVVGIVSFTPGDYSAVPLNPAASTGGSGAGATFNVSYGLSTISVVSKGSGYAISPVLTVIGGGGSGALVYCWLDTLSSGTSSATNAAFIAAQPHSVGQVVIDNNITWEAIHQVYGNQQWFWMDADSLFTTFATPDSHDSYASTMLSLVWRYVNMTGDWAWLNGASPIPGFTYTQCLQNIFDFNLQNQLEVFPAGAINSQLTTTFQGQIGPWDGSLYNINYLEDNTESYSGFQDAAALFGPAYLNDATRAAQASVSATNVGQGIFSMFDTTYNVFALDDKDSVSSWITTPNIGFYPYCQGQYFPELHNVSQVDADMRQHVRDFVYSVWPNFIADTAKDTTPAAYLGYQAAHCWNDPMKAWQIVNIVETGFIANNSINIDDYSYYLLTKITLVSQYPVLSSNANQLIFGSPVGGNLFKIPTQAYTDSRYGGNVYTVATLPTGMAGDRAYVTDATAPTFLGTLTGGGTVLTPVFHNGSAWVAG